MNRLIYSLLSLSFLVLSLQAKATPSIKNLAPNDYGKVSVQVRASSIFQYSPIILCDSYDFQMRHFSSAHQGNMLFVELHYQTQGRPLGASCSVFFVEDDLKEFDFDLGQALLAGPEAFRFVIR